MVVILEFADDGQPSPAMAPGAHGTVLLPSGERFTLPTAVTKVGMEDHWPKESGGV